MSRREDRPALDDDPLWYKDAVIYEVHVRSFYDSDGDGVGDFAGLTRKLDYLEDLGVTAVWLLPFYPSPLKDDGYDIGDYTAVHPIYGSIRDFGIFVREAHRRGLRVITELIINHTSDQHAWFQRARRSPQGSRWREYYVWSDTAERYQDARIIFKDFESSNWAWDPVAHAYYWHRFYTHQPDLNFDNQDVRRAVRQVVDFWLRLGVDGLRLDAVPYLYEREGTSCENLPETHGFLRALRTHIDERFSGRMLLAEANQWPEDASAYFGDGDECHMAFHFPLMPRLFMAIRMEDRYPIIEILEQTPELPQAAQWALFLRNHDELTLEMVTDEDRDYMYRVYGQDGQARINLGIRRRLAPLLGNHRRRIELMNGLLFSLPGTPVIYYGDEIGMGDNIYQGDRNGVRTPMQWSADRNAGFSRANPQQLFLPVIIDPEYHSETVNVEAQQGNLHSLLWWMKRVIALRKRYEAFGRGTLEFLQPENRHILAFLRRYRDERVLVVANLSRFAQAVELDLREFEGAVPVEVFGRTEFPPIGELPYLLTLGPHAFYWFSIEPRRAETAVLPETEAPLPVVRAPAGWPALFSGRGKSALEALLPDYLRGARWFGGKARRLRAAQIVDAVEIGGRAGAPAGAIAFVRADYAEGEPETYVLPLALAGGGRADEIESTRRGVAIAAVETERGRAVLFDALWDNGFCRALLDGIGGRRRFHGKAGQLRAPATRVLRDLRRGEDDLEPAVLHAEQSNTSVLYGDQFILKLFRRPDEGMNPDLEIGRYLTEQRRFEHVPLVAGALEYERGRKEPVTIAILQGFVSNEGNAWEYTLDHLASYYEGALTQPGPVDDAVPPGVPLVELADAEAPDAATGAVGAYLESARLLGRRTGELHVALAAPTNDAAFAPEPMSPFDRRSMYQSMRRLTEQTFQLLRQRLAQLPDVVRDDAARVAGEEREILRRFQHVSERPITALRTRHHGDYHLGQVLYTGKDFVIIDFEGEPARPLSERRLKRSPLRDVAGMLRSFHYASHAALLQLEQRGVADEAQALDALDSWARFWHRWVSAAFLRGYLEIAGGEPFLPADGGALQELLDAFVLEKAVYELGYELNNRPDWVRIALRGVQQLLPARD